MHRLTLHGWQTISPRARAAVSAAEIQTGAPPRTHMRRECEWVIDLSRAFACLGCVAVWLRGSVFAKMEGFTAAISMPGQARLLIDLATLPLGERSVHACASAKP
jgi:hypothetical protein